MDSLNSYDSLDERRASTSAATDAGRAPLTVWGHISLSALWLGVNAVSAALLPIVLPVQILLFVAPGGVGSAQQAELLGWLSALGSVIALLAPPLVGALSDRSTSPWGRRRPYIVLGVAISVLGAWAMARAGDLNTLILAFLVLNLGFNVAIGAYQGLLPDNTPESQRGAASGYLGLMTILGNVGSLALAGALFASVTLTNARTGAGRVAILNGSNLFYGVTAAVMVTTAIVTLVWTRETPLSAQMAAALRPAKTGGSLLERRLGSLRALWLEPWRSHNFTWVFLTRAFVMMGLTLFLTFIEYYFANVVGATSFVSATAVVAGLALLGAVLSALALGILSDRMNRTLLVGVSSGLMALPALVFVIAPAQIPLWPLGLVFGLGYGAYTSVDWALAVDALPVQANAGKDLGIWSAASTLPAILAPAVGALVIALVDALGGKTALGYQSIFALAAVCLALGAVFVSFIRGEPGAAPPSPAERPGAGWRLAGHSHGGQARGFLRFWPFWEWVTRTLKPVTPIPHAPHGLLGVHFARYHGQPITLPDGTRVTQGAAVAELHFNNRLLSATAQGGPWRITHMVADDLGALARWAQGTGEMAQVEAIVGVTLLGRAGRRVGFTLRERPVTLHARLERFFMQGLLAMYNPAGVQRLERGATYASYPVEVWMSRAELLRRYGGEAPAANAESREK
ncbi:MAG TPA: MFS transporter [Ktedonobacterales bacterium]